MSTVTCITCRLHRIRDHLGIQVSLSDFFSSLKLFNTTIILYALTQLSSLNNYSGTRGKTYSYLLQFTLRYTFWWYGRSNHSYPCAALCCLGGSPGGALSACSDSHFGFPKQDKCTQLWLKNFQCPRTANPLSVMVTLMRVLRMLMLKMNSNVFQNKYKR